MYKTAGKIATLVVCRHSLDRITRNVASRHPNYRDLDLSPRVSVRRLPLYQLFYRDCGATLKMGWRGGGLTCDLGASEVEKQLPKDDTVLSRFINKRS